MEEINQIIISMSIDELIELRDNIDRVIHLKKTQRAYEKNLSDRAAAHRSLLK